MTKKENYQASLLLTQAYKDKKPLVHSVLVVKFKLIALVFG